MTTLGVVFVPQFPPERLRSVVEAADRAGLGELWLWEDCFLEGGVASAAAAVAWSERLTIGIGVLPVPLRNVALTAMEVATLHRLAPGRIRVGVGHGVLDWMAQVGERVASPMTLLSEYVTSLRRLLGGERVSVDGRYVRLDGVALDWPPTGLVAVLVGAIGPRTMHLAGEFGDGVVLTGGTSPDQVRDAVGQVEAGRAAAARTDPAEIVVYLPAATAANRGEGLGVVGNASVVGEAVRRLAEAGAGTVVLIPTADVPEAFVRFVAEEVRPLVDGET
jgi:alkanesulfonate monooxygenase SsuD/methylene tetrahydromethanopterin reductase-like flavin-dependent oxidoreductase (luciferase family)